MTTTRKLASLLLAVAFAVLPVRAYALPEGASVVSGADVPTVSGSTMTINQNAAKAIINYDKFNIGAGETVIFVQPSDSAIALNRVAAAGGESQILGALQANGKVFLINPNGILFGAGSRIDTAGLVASSLGITDAEFLGDSSYVFSGNGAAVVNAGTINAPGGYVVLLGSSVSNSGVITTTGSIALQGGKQVTVALDPSNIVSVVVNNMVTDKSGDEQVVNSGTLKAGDTVYLTAYALDGLFKNAVNHTGVTEGKTVKIETGGDVIISGEVTADGGASGFGNVWVNTYGGSITASGKITAKGGDKDIVGFITNMLKNIAGTKHYDSSFKYGSQIELCAGTDIYLGDLTADFIWAETMQGPKAGSIYDLGQVNARLLFLAANKNIGTSGKPIETDADIITAFSYGTGDVYIHEKNDVELGLYLPVVIEDTDKGTLKNGALGLPVAANDGRVFITAEGDVTINSVIAPRGGVYIASALESIYAGKGWGLSDGNKLINDLFPTDYALPYGMDLTGSPFKGSYAFAALDFSDPATALNLVAGDYSYLSSLHGTIGVGTPSSKDSRMSGGIMGNLKSGITAVTGVGNSPDIDPIEGYPEGYVIYDAMYGAGQQIYPVDAGTGLTFENPLRVNIKVGTFGRPAVRSGFVPTSALTLQFSSVTDDGSQELAALLNQYYRAYYEILNVYRLKSFEPATPTTFFAYHPVTPTDTAAFDGLQLSEDLYSFIDNSISMRGPLSGYFGFSVDDEKKKK